VVEDDIGYHFQDDENKTILVKAIRIKYHPSGSVRTIHVDFENQDSLRNALYLKKPFRDKAIRIDVAVSTPARDGPRRDGPRRDDRDRDRGGLRGTQYDIDAKEAEWMAQRVQEKVVIDDAPVAASPKASSSAPSNPFGNAAPRDEAAYQAKKAAERAARAEERKKEPEEKKKSAAEKPDVPSGNWRDNAKPVEPSGGGRGGGERGGPGGGRGGAAAGRGGGDRERTKDGPPRERDGPPRERAPAEKKAEVKPVKAPPVKAPEAPKPEPKKPGKANLFELLGEEDDWIQGAFDAP